MEEQDYVDVWHYQNPDAKFFTHISQRKDSKWSWSRIDYFLLSQSTYVMCVDSSIKASVCTDHSLIEVMIASTGSKRGPGFWKFNNNLLNDQEFVDYMDNVITGCLRGYDYLSAQDLWDLLKFKIKQMAHEWSKERMRSEKVMKFVLYEKLSSLQQEIINRNGVVDGNLLRNINLTKSAIDAHENCDAKRTAFRCKKEWINSGERHSKYYFNLEKCNNIAKTMYMVRKADGTLTKDNTEILNVQHDFYSDLYTSNAQVNFNLVNQTDVMLQKNIKEEMDTMISVEELFNAMMMLKVSKMLECDGLTLEFYRKFWKSLRTPLYANYCKSLNRGEFNRSAHKGIINLIPKKGKDELWVKNWRPITLSLADLGGGVRDARPPLGVQILSISCSFWKIWRVHAPPGGFTPPPRENPGSATDC